MTTIVDYGAGNLRSVENTLQQVNAPYHITNQVQAVRSAEKIILPGVGHFGQMMNAIDALNLREPLLERLHGGTPFLGICVGLQCLFEASEESPGSAGLGYFPGIVQRFRSAARVPHMGWNSLVRQKKCRLLEGLGDEPFTYFAHSYYAPVVSATAAVCTYGEPYSAVIEEANVFAVQFHPEKSGTAGLQVIQNFLRLQASDLQENAA